MYLAPAYVVTAALLGAGVDKVSDASPFQAFLFGIGVAAVPILLAGWMGRKKASADIGAQLTDTALKIVTKLEARLAAAEAGTAVAQEAAERAAQSEHRCLERLARLETQVANLHPTVHVQVGASGE